MIHQNVLLQKINLAGVSKMSLEIHDIYCFWLLTSSEANNFYFHTWIHLLVLLYSQKDESLFLFVKTIYQSKIVSKIVYLQSTQMDQSGVNIQKKWLLNDK